MAKEKKQAPPIKVKKPNRTDENKLRRMEHEQHRREKHLRKLAKRKEELLSAFNNLRKL